MVLYSSSRNQSTDAYPIFSTPIWVIKGNLPNNIIEWVEEYTTNNPCQRRTNKGGYQSEAKLGLEEMPIEYNSYIKDKLNFLPKFYFDNWWLNINYKGSYNECHTHPGSDLAVIWYLTDNHGLLKLLDPMLHTRWMLYNKLGEHVTKHIDVKAGDMVIFPGDVQHSVEEHQLDTPRICISINLKLQEDVNR